MKQRPRIYYTESQKALMWERWRQGESLQKIAQLFGRNHPSIIQILAATGGIRPVPRCRSRLALTLAEREEISRAVVAGQSVRSISLALGLAPSTHQPGDSAQWWPGMLSGKPGRSVPGIVHDALSPVSWQRTGSWRTSWPPSFNCSGHRSRLPGG
jgi:hypothetical protein